MPQPKQACFDEKLFRQFIDEQIDQTQEAEVLQHLESCQQCQAALEKIAAQPKVWDDIKDHLDERRLADLDSDTLELDSQDRNRDFQFIKNMLAPTDDPSKIGRLGNYEVCGIIGRGAAGIVVKALDTRLNRFVAIKILAPVYSSNGSARRRFEREGRSIASVKDDHVIPVYTVDEFQGNPYIVMEYVPDGSLLQRIERRGPLESDEVVCVAMQVARGLAAAHSRGIVHRDVKPANVLLESGVDRAMVTDFGLARVVDEATMTRSGAISGTPQFMSPEQAKGESLDQRSDLFSLGSVMYAACTGRSPFRSETVFGVIKRVCETEPRPIREVNPKIEPWLVQFIAKLHAKDPDLRFESASQVADLLSQELAHMRSPTIVEVPARTWMPTKPLTRQPVKGLGYFVAAFAVIALIFGGWQSGLGTYLQNNFPSMMSMGLFQDQEQETPEFTHTAKKVLQVKEDGKLVLRTNLGSLVVKTHDDPTVEMVMTHTIAAEDQAAADRIFEGIKLNYDLDAKELAELGLVDGRDAAILATFPEQQLTKEEIDQSDDLEELKEKLRAQKSMHKRNARFELRIPASLDVNLDTQSGSIQLPDLDGSAILVTDGGHVEAGNINGTLKIASSGGHIDVLDAGSDASLITEGGYIKIHNVDGNLIAHTGGGQIQAGLVNGATEAKTGGGQIVIARSKGPIKAVNTSGQILVQRAEDSVNANSVNGTIRVNFVDQPTSESKLISGNGRINVGLPKDLGFAIDASTDLGRVSGPFIEKRTKSFNQNIKGGGQPLLAETSNGNIQFFYLEDSVNGLLNHKPTDKGDRSAFSIAFDHHAAGEFEEAIKAYELAVEEDVNKTVSLYNLGCIWSQKGEDAKAFASLNQAIDLGFTDLDQFEFDEELKPIRKDARFKKLIKRIHSVKETHKLVNRGQNRANQGEYEEAVSLLKSALEVSPDNLRATFYLGYSLHMGGNVDEAIPYHEKAAKTEEYAALGNYNLGCAYALKGESKKALEYLHLAVESGFYDIGHMKHDPDLDSIRDNDEFKQLIEEIREEDDDACDDDCDCDCDQDCECDKPKDAETTGAVSAAVA